jgi:sulfite exporter TauE/SafE
MMLSAHRYRNCYFIGRLAAFSLAGAVAGEAGAVINTFFHYYHLSAASSILFGSLMITISLSSLFESSFPGQMWLAKRFSKINSSLTLLILRDKPLATFLFGFLTISLPCGQSLLVFSACALSGSMPIGLLNGFFFALLTSPSLLFSMHLHTIIKRHKKYYLQLTNLLALLVGIGALCRGLAEL